MIFQLWEDQSFDTDNWGITLIEKANKKDIMGTNPVLLLEFEAKDLEEASLVMNKYFGWKH
jgi:hypothetical protein